MIRTRTICLTLVLALACAAAGCAGEAVKKLGDGFQQQYEEGSDRLRQSVKRMGDGFTETNRRKRESFRSFTKKLASKYEEQHQPRKLVFFKENTPVAKRPAEAPADGPAAAVVRAPDIVSDLLSEQTLERRGLRLLWKLDLDGSPIRYADLYDGRFYVVTTRNVLSCIELESGLTQWMYDLKRRPDGPPGFNSEYVVISAGDTIRVIDRVAGVDKWRFETDIQPCSRPLVRENVFAFGCWNGDVCGFKFGDRHPRWRFRTGAGVFSAPMMYGGFLLAATDKGTLVRYNTASKMRSGDSDIGGRPVGDLVGTANLAFVGSENFELVAFRAVDGRKAWAHGGGGRAVQGPWLSLDGEVVYYAAKDDGMYALTAATGKVRWRLAEGLRPIAVSGDDLYVLRTDGVVCNVNADTGKVLWAESAKPFVNAISQVQTNTLCLISADGRLYALRPKE